MLLTLAVAFFISMLACMVLVRLGGRGVMLDQPNDRSLHTIPVPRTGGVAIALGMLPTMLLIFPGGDAHVRLVIVGWVLVFGVSLLDDLYDLPAWSRLAVHCAAGLLVVLPPAYPGNLLLIAIGMFWIVWGTNLFNFMDGMDGLAGSMALIGGAALGIALFMTGQWQFALLMAVTVAAVTGFLGFNLPPARIFMGDSGAAPLGFLFAASAVSGIVTGSLPGWLPILVFLPFIADASFTLVRRLLRREPFWRPHRTHAYQKLVLSGRSAGRVLAYQVTGMLLCAGAVFLLSLDRIDGWLLLAAAFVVVLSLYCVIMRINRQGN